MAQCREELWCSHSGGTPEGLTTRFTHAVGNGRLPQYFYTYPFGQVQPRGCTDLEEPRVQLPSPFGCCVSLIVLPLPVACDSIQISSQGANFLHHLFLLCYSYGFLHLHMFTPTLAVSYMATTGILLKHTNETAHNRMTRGVPGRNGPWCIQNKSIQFLFPVGQVPNYNSPVTYHSTCPLKTCSAPISSPKLEALGGQASCQSHIPPHPSHHLEHIALGSW